MISACTYETPIKHALKVCTLGFGSFVGEDITTHPIPHWWEREVREVTSKLLPHCIKHFWDSKTNSGGFGSAWGTTHAMHAFFEIHGFLYKKIVY